MKCLKLGLVQLLLFGALGLATVSPALAELPDVHVLSGETYPVRFVGTVENPEVAVLETELGEKLTGSSLTGEDELTELSSLGPTGIIILGTLEPKKKTACHTAGDPEGTVKFAGEFHFTVGVNVPRILQKIVLFKELVVECNSGKLKVKVRSPIILKVEKVTSGVEVTEVGVVAKCTGKGKQEQKEYLNDEEKAVKGALTVNFGLGFESACENISSELVMKANKMLDLLF
jgi:hypothetical protein